MPKIKCPCGSVINLSEVPCRAEYLVLPEAVLDELEQQESTVDGLVERADRAASRMYRCSVCDRLLLFWEPARNIVQVYAPDRSA